MLSNLVPCPGPMPSFSSVRGNTIAGHTPIHTDSTRAPVTPMPYSRISRNRPIDLSFSLFVCLLPYLSIYSDLFIYSSLICFFIPNPDWAAVEEGRGGGKKCTCSTPAGLESGTYRVLGEGQ